MTICRSVVGVRSISMTRQMSSSAPAWTAGPAPRTGMTSAALIPRAIAEERRRSITCFIPELRPATRPESSPSRRGVSPPTRRGSPALPPSGAAVTVASVARKRIEYLVFDIETVPDTTRWHRPELPAAAQPQAGTMFPAEWFPPTYAHRVIAIGCLWLDADYRLKKL